MEPVAWDLAERVAVRVAGREPFAGSYHAHSLGPDFAELTAEAEQLVAATTGLHSLAGPASERSPVAAVTSSSASAVSSAKSGSSEWAWYEPANGSRPATRTAMRSARAQSMASEPPATGATGGGGTWVGRPWRSSRRRSRRAAR